MTFKLGDYQFYVHDVSSVFRLVHSVPTNFGPVFSGPVIFSRRAAVRSRLAVQASRAEQSQRCHLDSFYCRTCGDRMGWRAETKRPLASYSSAVAYRMEETRAPSHCEKF